MKVLSVINYMGGIGKTTLTLELAAGLACNHGQRVLLVDLDPQANLTFSIVPLDTWREHLESDSTIKFWYDTLLDENTEISFADLVYRPRHLRYATGFVDLIASHVGLIDIDQELANRLTRGRRGKKANNYIRVLSSLRRGLSESEITENYDLVMINCPPNFNVVTRTAIVASDGYFVPTKADYLSTLGIEQLNRHVDALTKDFNQYLDESQDSSPPISPTSLGLVFTMFQIYHDEPIQDQQQHIDRVRRLRLRTLQQMLRANNRFYSRRTAECTPLVVQRNPDPGFQEIRVELENVATEVMGVINVL